MPIPYVVRAQVHDIRHYRPQRGDKFLVDTNVWYWCTSVRASQNTAIPAYQTMEYPEFLKRCRRAQAQLFYCNLSTAELASCYESEEHYDYAQANNQPNMKLKEFRHARPEERRAWLTEFIRCLRWVRQMSTAADVMPGVPATNAAATDLTRSEVDPYDSWIAQAMVANEIRYAITDDGDWITIQGIDVVTANPAAIRAAMAAGRLIGTTNITL